MHGCEQNAADKLRATVDELRRKNELAEGELQRTKRELDEISRHSRQNEHDTSARDAKLNRALEEVEKQKTLLARKDTEAREKLDAAKRASDALFAENKRLQRQKSELMAAFKKQAQLIALAQMHVEAVKLLQFTEDEFVRALNWDL
nr:Golgin sub A member 2 [Polyrhizophydium stewartii]